VCLGAKARAHNEQLKRDYQYKLDKREREWMQTMSMTGVERVQYEQGITASNLGLANTYTAIQEKHGEMVDEMLQKSLTDRIEYLSKNKGDEFKAAGRLGKSADRLAALELGAYLKKSHDYGLALTKATDKLYKSGAQAAAKARSEQLQMFTNVAFVKNPDMLPPKPVGQNVGHAVFMDALSILGTAASVATPFVAGSSKKLKDNIVKIGRSIAGHNIYKFNYKGDARRYVGVIAEEIQQTVPEAVVTMPSGFLGVIYDLIDVQFKEVA
tara:strand:- start:1510 stop:2316 length:807 start_codon:yes stop_codon:yes gene_type:complete